MEVTHCFFTFPCYILFVFKSIFLILVFIGKERGSSHGNRKGSTGNK